MSVLRHNAERMTLSDLKQFLDKTVTLRMTDGEIPKVRVLVVDERIGAADQAHDQSELKKALVRCCRNIAITLIDPESANFLNECNRLISSTEGRATMPPFRKSH